MSEDKETPPPPMEDLARQYMDLWRDQLQGMAADPDVSATLAQTMQMMNAGFANLATSAENAMTGQQQSPPNEPEKNHHDAKPAPDENDGAAPSPAKASGTSPSTSDAFVHQLESRLANLEQRVATLEAELKKPRRSPRRKTAKSAP